ncbi:MAG: hypothetical protein QXP36_03140 [Conexivisphaerales archaeon]
MNIITRNPYTGEILKFYEADTKEVVLNKIKQVEWPIRNGRGAWKRG